MNDLRKVPGRGFEPPIIPISRLRIDLKNPGFRGMGWIIDETCYEKITFGPHGDSHRNIKIDLLVFCPPVWRGYSQGREREEENVPQWPVTEGSVLLNRLVSPLSVE